jgi:hypothetical protein
MKGKKLEIKSGDKYGRLTIVKEVKQHITPSGQIKRKFNCVCECGNIIDTQLNGLIAGNTISCGCYRRKKIIEVSTTHGLSKHPLYKTWKSMKERCYNPNIKRYKDYGGRGIKVCDRWLSSFENFLIDMGEKPTSQHSIDRIDVNGNYEPNNCKWATSTEQRINQRRKYE